MNENQYLRMCAGPGKVRQLRVSSTDTSLTLLWSPPCPRLAFISFYHIQLHLWEITNCKHHVTNCTEEWNPKVGLNVTLHYWYYLLLDHEMKIQGRSYLYFIYRCFLLLDQSMKTQGRSYLVIHFDTSYWGWIFLKLFNILGLLDKISRYPGI